MDSDTLPGLVKISKWTIEQLEGKPAWLEIGGNVSLSREWSGILSAQEHQSGMILKFVMRKGTEASPIPLTQGQADATYQNENGEFEIPARKTDSGG